MAFKEIDEVLEPDLILPVQGKKYRIPPVDGKTGIKLQKLTTLASRAKAGQLADEDLEKLKLDDDEEKDLYQRVLGPVYDELLEDGVDWERIKFVAQTATVRAMANNEAAETYWNAGGKRPKARKKPADRRARSAK